MDNEVLYLVLDLSSQLCKERIKAAC